MRLPFHFSCSRRRYESGVSPVLLRNTAQNHVLPQTKKMCCMKLASKQYCIKLKSGIFNNILPGHRAQLKTLIIFNITQAPAFIKAGFLPAGCTFQRFFVQKLC